MQVIQAFDGTLIREIETDDGPALEQKLSRAASAFSHTDVAPSKLKRLGILRRLAALIAGERDDFSRLIAQEGGKPWVDAKVEVTRAIHSVELAASSLEHLAGSEVPMGNTKSSQQRWAFTTHEPIGPVAAISAFNHPLNLIAHQVAPAIAAGCPVIVKPASTTPLCALRFVALAIEAGCPEAYCQTAILDDNALASKLASDPRVRFLSFIGSAKVGWSLRSQLAPGTRCALEHGGSAPLILDQSVDLAQVIEPIVKGAYYHAGQVCVSTQRIFVHEQVFDDFLARFTERVKALRVGDPLQEDTEVGPLILPKEVQRVAEWVDEARVSGASIPVGGKPLNSRCFAPTVVVEPKPGAKLSRAEVFGPVACIYRFSELDDAIARANSLPLAFQASIFTRDLDVALRAANRLDAATVLINDHTAFRIDAMPFAGRKESGYGIGGIPYTLRDMLQEKMVVFNGVH